MREPIRHANKPAKDAREPTKDAHKPDKDTHEPAKDAREGVGLMLIFGNFMYKLGDMDTGL